MRSSLEIYLSAKGLIDLTVLWGLRSKSFAVGYLMGLRELISPLHDTVICEINFLLYIIERKKMANREIRSKRNGVNPNFLN